MKALIISVGTGVRSTERAVESLAKAMAFSINHHNPDKIFFIVTKESRETTLPKILQKTKVEEYETLEIGNPDDIQEIYETFQGKFKQMREEFDEITVDYTSGTKAMTSALTILGTIYEVNTLSYITGKRKDGIVQSGTEKISIVRPYFATIEQKIKTAIQFFNQNQFSATQTILKQIRKTTKDLQITQRIKPLLNLAEAYALWDRFQHEKAFQKLKKIDKEELGPNKKFLGQLVHNIKKNKDPEPFYIADLINNAKRRGTDERRYDDAVARLYRTIELIAQHTLKKEYKIETSQVKPEQIPKGLLKEWNVPPNTKIIKISLTKAYELLNAENDELGQKFLQDRKLRNLLSKRNTSILAHHLTPVTQETYRELYQKTLEYAKIVVKNLDQLIRNSKFIKWKE